jgi:hypothetical protein
MRRTIGLSPILLCIPKRQAFIVLTGEAVAADDSFVVGTVTETPVLVTGFAFFNQGSSGCACKPTHINAEHIMYARIMLISQLGA